jgi:hypothetical protein
LSPDLFFPTEVEQGILNVKEDFYEAPQ